MTLQAITLSMTRLACFLSPTRQRVAIARQGLNTAQRRLVSKMKILCVAEKPSIAKAVAEHLSGGRSETVSLYPKPAWPN